MLVGVLVAGIVIVTATTTVGWLAGRLLEGVSMQEAGDELMDLIDPGRFFPTNRHAAAAFRRTTCFSRLMTRTPSVMQLMIVLLLERSNATSSSRFSRSSRTKGFHANSADW
jgi:hypothetical protein